MSADPLVVRQRAHMAEVISRLQVAGFGWRVPIYSAAMRGDLVLCELSRGAAAPKPLLKHHPRPLLVVVGDDDGGSSGPAGWAQTDTLLRWARAVMVNAVGGQERDYALAAAQAVVSIRVLMVETSGAQGQAWVDAALRFNLPGTVLHVRTPAGAPAHPCLGAPPGVVVS